MEYDEFGLFHENAAEFGLPFDEPPTVRREEVGRLSALVWGDAEPELVFLHGGGQNAHTWDTVALALRPRPLVAIDLPGHGHSDGPGSGARDGAAEVEEVVRALAPQAKAVVGMSFGGFMAIALAERAPDLVRKLVLVDVLPGLQSDRAQHIVDFIRGPATFPDFDELLQRTMQFNPHRSESSLRRGILHNAIQLDDGSWIWRHQQWEKPEGAAPPDDLTGALAGLRVPVLLCRGMRADSVLGDEDEERLRTLQPTAEIEHFVGAGHSIQGDMPVELAAAIDRFAPA